MKGPHAFCPKTGASLSSDRHYDADGRYRRHPVDDGDAAPSPDGELTNGERRSSTVALFGRFRRCHRRHRDPDDDLYRTAALALRRLKRATTADDAWDLYVWSALGEYLARDGHDVEWMAAHVEPRCPGCHGRLRYDRCGDALHARCATDCGGCGPDALATIRDRVAALYGRAFDASPDADALVFAS